MKLIVDVVFSRTYRIEIDDEKILDAVDKAREEFDKDYDLLSPLSDDFLARIEIDHVG